MCGNKYEVSKLFYKDRWVKGNSSKGCGVLSLFLNMISISSFYIAIIQDQYESSKVSIGYFCTFVL